MLVEVASAILGISHQVGIVAAKILGLLPSFGVVEAPPTALLQLPRL